MWVKITRTRGQSAGVRSISTFEASQRLNTENLSSLNTRSVYRPCIHSQLNKLLSKPYLIVKNGFSTKATFTGDYLSGLSDGEACFHISVLKDKNYKSGFKILPIYTIQLHIKDLKLLEEIKAFFGLGVITIKKTGGSAIYSIQSYKELISVLIPHFDKYPLITQKKADYLLFKSVLDIMSRGDHLTEEGLKMIISIKASMNNGLSNNLKTVFPCITPVKRPVVQNSTTVLDPYWLAGFVEAEGCFICLIKKQSTHKSGNQILLNFILTQHSRDLDLMLKIKEYLGFGIISTPSGKSLVRLDVTKKTDIDTLIAFFKNYTFFGSKKLDFNDFSLIQEIIKAKLHTTEKGLDRINLIKSRMNSKRDDN
jgi:hypothetical protein